MNGPVWHVLQPNLRDSKWFIQVVILEGGFNPDSITKYSICFIKSMAAQILKIIYEF